MASRAQVQAQLQRGLGYEAAARELGIPAGLVFMIATGSPADASGTPDTDLTGLDGASPQRLLRAPPVNPQRNPTVLDWVTSRATRELTPPR